MSWGCGHATDLDLRQLQDLGEGVDAVGVGRQRVQTLTAEDGGGHGPQPVAAHVQLLQQLQSSQFAVGGNVIPHTVSPRRTLLFCKYGRRSQGHLAVKVCSWL